MPGFIPNSRGTFILDFIVVAMAIILPILLYSVSRVKYQRKLKLHRFLQMGLGLTLGIAVIAFELDMRINGWRHLAEASPYYDSLVFPALIVHLCFAIPTLILWSYTISAALRHSIDTKQNKARIAHKTLGLYSSYSMTGTAITGWFFYYLAFMAV